MTEQDIHTQVTAWRRTEGRFYGSVLYDADLYMASLRLVREVVNSLADVEDLETLVDRFAQVDARYVIPIADGLDIPQLVLLDYDLVLGAAFYLRSQEIQEAVSWSKAEARIAAAREQGQAWVVLYDEEAQRNGYTFFRRLEMHLPDGVSLHTANELDWEKGRVFAIETLMLDPQTGRIRQGVKPPDPRQEFTTREAMLQAVAALRDKYSDIIP